MAESETARLSQPHASHLARLTVEGGYPPDLELERRFKRAAQMGTRLISASRVGSRGRSRMQRPRWVARFMDLVRNGTDSDALRAMTELLSRAYGKPKETVEHQVSEVDRIAAMSQEERDAIHDRIEQRRAVARRLGVVE